MSVVPSSKRVRRNLVGTVSAFVGLSLVGGIVASALALPLLGVTKATHDITMDVFEDLPTSLDESGIAQMSTMYASDGQTVLAQFYSENRVPVRLNQISPNLQHAVIAIEDKRFYEHGAIDAEGMARAFFNNLTSSDVQGGSTLTQQYVKNVLIEDAMNRGDRTAAQEAQATTYSRKLREAKLAIALEKRKTKDEVLEGYLNIAPFGSQLYGAESAARFYFNKPAAELSPVEAATIAAVTQFPSAYDPSNPENVEANRKRRDVVLDQMKLQGYITEDEYRANVAVNPEDILHITPSPSGCEVADVEGKHAGYFCDYVVNMIRNSDDFAKGIVDKSDAVKNARTKEAKAKAAASEREKLLKRGGLKIYTTLDLAKQNAAYSSLTNMIPVDDPSQVKNALASVEPGTGKVLALTQNTAYSASGQQSPVQTSINYSVDEMYGGSKGFQAGSTFKTFILAQWLKEGHTLNESVRGRTNWQGVWKARCEEDGVYRQTTSQNITGGGPRSYTPLYATEWSVNTAYAAMEFELDLCDVRQTMADVGFHPASYPDNVDPKTIDPQAPIPPNPAMVLGTDLVSPLTMATVAATYASGGTRCDPYAITKVVGPEGKELQIPKHKCKTNAITPEVAAGVTYGMQRQVTSGLATSASIGRPLAAKTGTTENSYTGWIFGATPQVASAVFSGYPDGLKSLEGVYVNGHQFYNVFGIDISGPPFRDYMKAANDGLPKMPFPNPPAGMMGSPRRTTVAVPEFRGMSFEQAQAAATKVGLTASKHTEGNQDSWGGTQYPAGTVAYQAVSAGSQVLLGTDIKLAMSAGAPE